MTVRIFKLGAIFGSWSGTSALATLRTNRMTTDGRLTEKSMFSITETISVPLTEDFISSYVNCTNKQKKIIKIKTKNKNKKTMR